MPTKAKPAAANPYEWYDNAMKGIRGQVHDGEPQTGWYRNRKLVSPRGETPKRYEMEAVAYWKDTATGEQRCHINGKSVSEDRMMQTWIFCNVNPISEEIYDAFIATGKWPEHNEALSDQERASNEAPDDDSLEGVRARIDALVGEANRLLKKGAAKTKAEADSAGDVAVKLSELFTHADKLRKLEKDPHKKAAEAVDAKWNPVRDAANIYLKIKEMVVNPWIKAETKRREDEAAAENKRKQKIIDDARAEAAAKQALIDEEHRKATELAIENNKPIPIEPEQVEVQVPATFYETAPAKPEPVRVGTGRTIGARTVKTMLIEDYAKALAHFAENPAVKEVIQSLADKAAKLDMEVPGCKILKDGKAV